MQLHQKQKNLNIFRAKYVFKKIIHHTLKVIIWQKEFSSKGYLSRKMVSSAWF